MKFFVYPTLEETLELHQKLIERFGGQAGVRDMGLLESALYRPQTGYYDSLSEQAAALLQSLLKNHPFVDGNKRVGFALTAIFLRINGIKLHVKVDGAEKFIVEDIIRRNCELNEIVVWLERHMKKI